MRIILLILLFMFACDEDCTEDCNGDCNGVATVDDCGRCAGNNIDKDCRGDCFGDAVVDECGECNGDNSTCIDCMGAPNGSAYIDMCDTCDADLSNDCAQDCMGTWGGDAEYDCEGECDGPAKDFGCGICINYDNTIFLDINNCNSTEILENVCSYKDALSTTMYEDSPDMESSYSFYPSGTGSSCNFYDSQIGSSKILISAPHSQRSYRYGQTDDGCADSQDQHCRDIYTGAYAQILHDLTGMPAIITKYKTDDPNYYDSIPDETLLYQNSIGEFRELIPYKKKIQDYLQNENLDIEMVIDLHGKANARSWDVDIGTGIPGGESLESEFGECIPDIITYIFEKYNMEMSYNDSPAWINETVTRFVAQEINRDMDSVQFEMRRDYRGGCSDEPYPDNYYSILMAYVELINTMNYIYNSEIISQ